MQVRRQWGSKVGSEDVFVQIPKYICKMLTNICVNVYIYLSVTSESLVSRDFSRFFLKFHLSISVLRYFNFTFTSRKEWNNKSFHFSFLEKGERNICFTFHFSKKSERISDFTLFLEKRVKNKTKCNHLIYDASNLRTHLKPAVGKVKKWPEKLWRYAPTKGNLECS